MRFTSVCVVVLSATSAALAAHWPAKNPSINLRLRTLVLTGSDDPADDTVQLPRLILEGFNTDWVAMTTLPDLTNPDYNAIVVSRGWTDEAEIRAMRLYASTYGTRIVYLHADESMVGNAATPGGAFDGFVAFDTAPYAKAVGDVMTTNQGWALDSAVVPIPMQPAHASTRAVINFTNSTDPVTEGPLAVFTTTANGVEEMFIMWDATKIAFSYSPSTGRDNIYSTLSAAQMNYTHLNLALGSMWHTWSTRGVFPGMRRSFLVIQPDDWFMTSSVYNSNTIVRCDRLDCESAVEEMAYISSLGAPGTDFRIELPFNGLGWNLDKMGPGLNQCSEENRDKFNWISHTYSHQHLDWANNCGNGNATCIETTPETVQSELQKNVDLIDGSTGHMFVDDPEGLAKYFSSKSMVTPEISALVPAGYTPVAGEDAGVRIYGRPRNNQSLTVLEDFGIRYVAGDNSRQELLAKNPHHALRTTLEGWGVDNIFIIPRQATSIDYDIKDPDTYKAFWDSAGVCSWQIGAPCGSFPYSFDVAMQRESLGFLNYALQYRADPYMMHQINLKTFDYENKTRSLLGVFAEGIVKGFSEYLGGMPITSPKMDDLGKHFENRMARDACNLAHTAHIVNGVFTGYTVTGNDSCLPSLTFTSGFTAAAQPAPGLTGSTAVYAYGGDRNVITTLSANSTSATVSFAGPAPASHKRPSGAPAHASPAAPVTSLGFRANDLPAGRHVL